MESVEVLKKADRKLTFIPVLFILLRMWGTIRFFRFLACLPDCHHLGPRPAYRWLEILQVSMQPVEDCPRKLFPIYLCVALNLSGLKRQKGRLCSRYTG